MAGLSCTIPNKNIVVKGVRLIKRDWGSTLNLEAIQSLLKDFQIRRPKRLDGKYG